MEPDSKPIHPFFRWLRGIFVLSGVTVSLMSLLGLLGRFNWILDLFSHFRVQYVISLSLISGILLMLRCRKTALIFILLAVVNCIYVMPLFFGGQNSNPNGSPILRVMLLNVNTNTGDPELVKRAIQEANPDILVLEEISARWLENLAWLKASHPYAITQPRDDNFGIGLFSKLQIVDGKIEHIGMNIPSILATIKTTGNYLHLVATHPTPPASRDYSRWRNKQLDQLPSVLCPPWPLILVGDLNVTPWNSHFQSLIKRTGLKDSATGRGFHPTWPNDNWFLRIPIDHILHSPDIKIVKRRVGNNVASDHYPVIVDILVLPNMTEKATDIQVPQ